MIVTCIAKSPIAHASFGPSTGNAILFRRLKTARGSEVPAISGNALRAVMRRLVMRDLFQACGLGGHTEGWDALYAALANGGHLQGAETSLDPERVRKLREAVPALSVFGAALRTWMMSGRVSVGILWPICRETVEERLIHPAIRPSPDEKLKSAEDLVDEISHVRHVDREEQRPELSGVTPMPTTMEVLRPGTSLISEIVLKSAATDVEAAVMPWAINQIEFLGGKSAAGLGRVDINCAEDTRPYAVWRENEKNIARAAEALIQLAKELAGGPRGKKQKAASDR